MRKMGRHTTIIRLGNDNTDECNGGYKHLDQSEDDDDEKIWSA